MQDEASCFLRVVTPLVFLVVNVTYIIVKRESLLIQAFL